MFSRPLQEDELLIIELFCVAGRLEDSLLGGGGGGSSKRNADTLGLGTGKRSGIMWNNFSGHHAFTTGRGRGGGGGAAGEEAAPYMGKSRPKGPSQTLKVGGGVK